MSSITRQLAIVNNPQTIFQRLIPFIIGVIGISIISGFSDKLTSIDKGIAQWAKSQINTEKHTYDFNTDLILFLNQWISILVIFPIIVIIYNLFYQIFAIRLRGKQNIYQIIFPTISFALYGLFSYGTVTALKKILSRPRPYQTIEFYPQFAIDDINCFVPFQPVFRQYKGENPCNYFLASCPSGHTQQTTFTLISMTYLSYYQLKQNKFHKAKLNQKLKYFIQVVDQLLLAFSATITLIFIPTVMVGRMAVLKHFFTDVCGGLCIGVMYLSIMLLMEPEDDQVDYDIIDKNPIQQISSLV